MAKIMAAEAALLQEQIVGWPYESPGATSDPVAARGIDCSGAVVRIAQKYGVSLPHGSNSLYRQSCALVGVISDGRRLAAGTLVFKCRAWDASQRGHSQYGQAPGDLYHVGMVTREDPVRVVHATPPAAKADASLKGWTHWGWLRAMASPSQAPDALQTGKPGANTPGPGQAWVTAQGARLRKGPGEGHPVIARLPQGAALDVLDEAGQWRLVRYRVRAGLWHEGYVRWDLLTE
ncbi:MAG: SH3 domain-containing protein [Oscillospiraceae bacterium]|jgi:hypothetical protein|nr:SH3 domain-containing protein [Oscillospiraceae bacterium]